MGGGQGLEWGLGGMGKGVGVRGAAVWTRGGEDRSLPWCLHVSGVCERVCVDEVWGSECSPGDRREGAQGHRNCYCRCSAASHTLSSLKRCQ